MGRARTSRTEAGTSSRSCTCHDPISSRRSSSSPDEWRGLDRTRQIKDDPQGLPSLVVFASFDQVVYRRSPIRYPPKVTSQISSAEPVQQSARVNTRNECLSRQTCRSPRIEDTEGKG